MTRILPRRSLLTYPAGTAPGFNLSHPAAQGIEGTHGLSAICNGGGFVNLATGTVGTTTLGGSGASIGINQNGPVFKWPVSNNSQSSVFTGTTRLDLVATMAIIGTFVNTPLGSLIWTDQTFGFRLDFADLTLNNVIAVSHGLTVPVAPVFYAASKTATAVNFVILNLATGKLLSTTVANASSAIAPAVASQAIGSPPASVVGTPVGSLSAAMWAPVGLSLQQLVQWAQDPWAFWYPNGTLNIKASTSPVTTTLYNLINVG